MRRLCRTFALTAAIAAAVQCFGTQAHAQTTIIPYGIENGAGPWEYLHTYTGANAAVNPDSDPGFVSFDANLAIWATEGAPDTVSGVEVISGNNATLTWQSGNAPFDWGTVNGIRAYITANAGSGTIITPDPPSGDRYTNYFRQSFNLSSPLDNISVQGLVDDGAVIFIDGFEVGRMSAAITGVPAGTIPPYISGTDGTGVGEEAANVSLVPLDLTNFGGVLTAGNHVIGFQVHNDSTTSSDLGLHVRVIAQVGTNELVAGATGSLTDIANWAFGSAPNRVNGDVIMNADAASTMYFNGDFTMGSLTMNNAIGYTIAGLGNLRFEATDGTATWSVQQGVNDMQIQTLLSAASDTTTATSLSLNVAAGATINFNNDVILNGNTFTKTGAGTAVFNNYVDGTIALAAGAASGNGTVGGDVNNDAAIVSPGDGVGVLTVNGNYSQGPQGALSIQIGGSDAGQFDVMQVLGIMDVNGSLNVSLVNGFEPGVGQSFDVFDFGGISGQFGTVNLPALSSGKVWDLTNLYAAGSLSVVPEPSTCLLGSFAALLLGMARRRR